jgi:hypothetical protein
MPNPLMSGSGGVRADESTDTQIDAIDPTMEEYAGENNPYRGIEQHGVVPNTSPMEEIAYSNGRPAVYDVPEDEPEPVAVRIVSGESSREIVSVRTDRGIVNNETRRIVNRMEGRQDLRIKNLHETKTMYIDEVSFAPGTANGFPIEAGETLSLGSMTDELYGVSQDGTDIPFAVMWLYSIPVKTDG